MTERNENRRGYKKTKVGWIPEDWGQVLLQDVCNVPVSGYSVNGTDEFVEPNGKDIGVIKLSCIQDGTFKNTENKKVIQKDIPKVVTPVRKNTMLISRSNTEALVGLVCFVDRDYPNLYLSDLIWEVSPSEPNNTDMHWLTYLLISNRYRGIISNLANGTSASMKKITKRSFQSISIPLPPLPEQKKIADILSTCDRTIHLTARMIEAKEKMKKGLMQQLLTGRLRFPEFGKPATKKGEVPEGWKKKKLCEIGRIFSGGTPDTQTPEFWNGVINWVTPSEVSNLTSRFIHSTEKKITEKGLRNCSATILKPNSIIVCTRATIGYCAINSVSMATNQGFKNIELYPDFETDFIYYQLTFNKKEFHCLAAGSTFLEVSKKDFEKISIKVPPTDEQRSIASLLSTIDEEIHLLKNQLAAHKKQKKALMQKLLTGQIRVKV